MEKFEYTVLEMIESAARTVKTAPLNLGGTGGLGGGVGGPPGGFIGQLPQYRVAYDMLEAATLDTLPSGVTGASGWSLVDNLNHIRYRLDVLESGGSTSFTVIDDNTPQTIPSVDTIHFSGAGVTVMDLGSGEVRVEITATGSGGGSVEGYAWDEYYLTSSNADVATYYYMKTIPPPPAGFAGGVTGSDYNFARFVCETGQSTASSMSNVAVKLYAQVSANIGGISVDTYAKLYKRDGGGTETLLGTSSTVNIVDTAGAYYTIPFTGSFSLASTDRIVIKLYGTVVGGSPAYCFVNMSLGADQLSMLQFKADFGQITGIYFDDGYNRAITQSGALVINFNDDMLRYSYLRLDTFDSRQIISRTLNVVDRTSGEGGLYVYTTDDSYTAEFHQVTDSTDVFSPVIYLYQETNTATHSGVLLQGYRSGTTSLFLDDWIRFENDDGEKFSIDKDGNAYSAGLLLVTDALSNGSTYGRKDGSWVVMSGGSGGLSHYYNDDLTSQIPQAISGLYTTSIPYASGTLRVYFNGVRQRKNYHYVEVSGYTTFRALYPTYSGDMMIVDFDY